MESAIQKKENTPLVYYRMPDEKEAWFLQSESVIEIDSLQNIPEKPGFILYPFSLDGSCKPLFIQANKLERMTMGDIHAAMLNDDIICESVALQTPHKSKNKEEYCKNITTAVEEIHSGKLQKVVLSRMKSINSIAPQNPLKIFYKLCNKYPAAFVSLVYIPGNITWITATPELLVSANENEIKTVSLAGTKPANSSNKWTEKEKTEQRIVTDYIHQILNEYCKNISISGPKEIVAGNVKHLKTLFSATLNTDLWSLVSALHPTPAVCGTPFNKARHFIEQTEGYDRKYYTGFLGPCNIDGRTNLFVNLRCAELFSNAVNLYIGGGITKDSVPESEWEETELKAKTLLFAFEENQNEEE